MIVNLSRSIFNSWINIFSDWLQIHKTRKEQSGFVRHFMAEIKSQLVIQNVMLMCVNIWVIVVNIYMLQDEERKNQKVTKYITV